MYYPSVQKFCVYCAMLFSVASSFSRKTAPVMPMSQGKQKGGHATCAASHCKGSGLSEMPFVDHR